MNVLIFNYAFIIVLCIKIKCCLCLSGNEEDIEDILKPVDSTLRLSEQKQESTLLVPDDKWLVNAMQDIAYYLRNHKFNEWDRRYFKQKPKDNWIGFYSGFPEPSLKTIHWKVYENCYKDFNECVAYLYSVIEAAPFTRSDDITTTLNKRQVNNKTLVTKLNNNCKKALLYTEKTGLPFDAPREKFQWRTSASYFMCWYTMMGVPALSMLGESCDNFANCLDSTFGSRNHDPRSDDKMSFACAIYSFCPDPCCPLKHIKTLSQCYDSINNPCFTENAKSTNLRYRQCRFDRKDNQNLDGIIQNKWNISCNCKEKGFEWKSQFGMCVDINECMTGKHNCDSKNESCFNLPGTFQCICKWEYVYDSVTKRCMQNNVLTNLKSKPDDNYYSIVDDIKCFLEYLGF